VARTALALSLAIALLVPLVASPAQAQADEATTPQGQDWRLDPSIEAGEGFTLATHGAVDGQAATVERSFDLEQAELTIRYLLGPEDDPARSVEAGLAISGVYVFEDDGDGRLDARDRIVEHQRVDPASEAYVTPVRVSEPFQAVRAVVGLEDTGSVTVTVTTTPQFAPYDGETMAPTEARVNVTALDLGGEDRHVALALDASAAAVEQPDDALVRLAGDAAAVDLASLGPGPASTFEEERGEDEHALVMLTGDEGAASTHQAQAGVVHTSGAVGEAVDAVTGQPGAFVLGLLAASVLVGATAWRKLN
jgi:hypothetical protein